MAGDGIGDGYWVPECARAYLRGAGYSTRALEDMEPHVREWDRWMRAVGEFYDCGDTDGFRRVYQVHRRTILPAMPDSPSSVRRAVVREKVLLLALPYELRARAFFSPYESASCVSARRVAIVVLVSRPLCGGRHDLLVSGIRDAPEREGILEVGYEAVVGVALHNVRRVCERVVVSRLERDGRLVLGGVEHHLGEDALARLAHEGISLGRDTPRKGSVFGSALYHHGLLVCHRMSSVSSL